MRNPAILVPRTSVLMKAVTTWPPKGPGWEPIPRPRGGRIGMRRRKPGGGYEYAYQDQVPEKKRQAVVARSKGIPLQASMFDLFSVAPADQERVKKIAKDQGITAALAETVCASGKLQPGAVLHTAEVVTRPKQGTLEGIILPIERVTPATPSVSDTDPRHAQQAIPKKRRKRAARQAANGRQGSLLYGSMLPLFTALGVPAPVVVKKETPRLKAKPAEVEKTADDVLADLEEQLGKDGSPLSLADTVHELSVRRFRSWLPNVLKEYEKEHGKEGIEKFLGEIHAAEQQGKNRKALLDDLTARIERAGGKRPTKQAKPKPALAPTMPPEPEPELLEKAKEEIKSERGEGKPAPKQPEWRNPPETVQETLEGGAESVRRTPEDVSVAVAPPETSEDLTTRGEVTKPAEKQGKAFSARLATVEAYGVRKGWGPVTRKTKNEEALALAQTIKPGEATAEQREILQGYSGRGGTGSDAFGALNEYYTPPKLSVALWSMLDQVMDLNGASVLEPSCGTGVFLEHAPEGVRQCVGVELDKASSQVARALHGGKHEVVTTSLEGFAVRDMRTFDAVIGNPPLGARGKMSGTDPEKRNLQGHEYAIDTGLDKLKDHGVLAMVVPEGVMTGQDDAAVAFRERIHQKGDLLGAFRLPTSTFGQAGASVTTDVIVMRKRRHQVVALAAAAKENLLQKAGAWDQGFVDGKYFDEHPKHVLGKVSDGFGGRTQVGGDLTDDLLVQMVGEKLTEAKLLTVPDVLRHVDDEEEQQRLMDASRGLRPYMNELGAIKSVDGVKHVLREIAPGKVGWRPVDDAAELAGLDVKTKEGIEAAAAIGKGMIDLRRAVADGTDARECERLRRDLQPKIEEWRTLYGNPAAVRSITDKIADLSVAGAFKACVRADGELCDLVRQSVGESTPSQAIATQPTTVESAAEKVARSANGIVDPSDVARVMGHDDASAVEKELLKSKNFFIDDDGQWVDKSRFLSGYMFEKRDTLQRVRTLAAEAAGAGEKLTDYMKREHYNLSRQLGTASSDDLRGVVQRQQRLTAKLALAENAADLVKKVDEQMALLDDQRHPVPLEELMLSVRSGWVPFDVLQAFWDSKATFDLRYNGTTYSAWIGNTEIRTSDDWKDAKKSYAGADWDHAMINFLNRRPMGSNMKLAVYGIDEEYKEWIMERSDLRDKVEESYNRTFHSFRARMASQDPTELKGWDYGQFETDPETGKQKHVSGGWTPHGYQYQAARWADETGKGILGDDVGLGKTTEVIAMVSAIQARGGAKKPLVVVPKALLRNWEKEIKALRPDAKILLIGEKEVKGRGGVTRYKDQSGVEKAAAWQDASVNQYDFIVATRKSFEMLRVGEENLDRYYDEAFENKLAANKDPEAAGRKRASFKADAAAKEAKKAELGAPLLDHLGIDLLFADEGHGYKNLHKAKSRDGQTVKYLGSSGQSARAYDMNWKTKRIRELNNGNGVFFATATPVKNSPLEVYNMLAQVAPEAFVDAGIRNSEEFIDRYCQIEEEVIVDAKGQCVRAPCVKGFKNLRELRTIASKFMVVRDAKQVRLAIPDEVHEGHEIDLTETQQATLTMLRAQLRALRDGKEIQEVGEDKEEKEKASKDDYEEGSGRRSGVSDIMDKMAELDDIGRLDHVFKVLHAMQMVTVAPHEVRDLLVGDPDTHNLASPKIAEMSRRCAEKVAAGPNNGQIIFCDLKNTLHHQIKDELVKQGIPADRIGIINRAECPTATDQQREAEKFQNGDYDVVIGNTACMGEGVNLQKRCTDMHHLDVPWDPGSMQQRNGRGVRQGNPNDKVKLHFYAGKGSFDGYKMSTVVGKSDWLHHLWHGTSDHIEIPEEAQGFTRDQLFILGSEDTAQALVELEEAKKARVKEYAEKRYAEAMRAYKGLRRTHQEILRQEQRKREGAAVDEKMLNAKRNFRDRAIRALQDNEFWPNKGALELENLGKGYLVEETGLLILPGSNITYPAPVGTGEVYLHVVDVSEDGTVIVSQFGTTSAYAGSEVNKLVAKNLKKATATTLTPDDQSEILAQRVARRGAIAIHEMPQEARDEVVSSLREKMREWCANKQSKSYDPSKITGYLRDVTGKETLVEVTTDFANKKGKAFTPFVGSTNDQERLRKGALDAVKRMGEGEKLEVEEMQGLRKAAEFFKDPTGAAYWCGLRAEDMSANGFVQVEIADAHKPEAFLEILGRENELPTFEARRVREWQDKHANLMLDAMWAGRVKWADVQDKTDAAALTRVVTQALLDPDAEPWLRSPEVQKHPAFAAAQTMLESATKVRDLVKTLRDHDMHNKLPFDVSAVVRGADGAAETHTVHSIIYDNRAAGGMDVWVGKPPSITKHLIKYQDLSWNPADLESAVAKAKADAEAKAKAALERAAREAEEAAKRAAAEEKRREEAKAKLGDIEPTALSLDVLRRLEQGSNVGDFFVNKLEYGTRGNYFYQGWVRGYLGDAQGAGPPELASQFEDAGWYWNRRYSNWVAAKRLGWNNDQCFAFLNRMAAKYNDAVDQAKQMHEAGLKWSDMMSKSQRTRGDSIGLRQLLHSMPRTAIMVRA